jgi:S1-C subfamily serine protease
MKRTLLLCAAALLAASSADARRPRRGKAVKSAPAASEEAAPEAPKSALRPSLAPRKPAPEAAPAAASALGASLRPAAGGLSVESAPADGPLAGLGLRPGDLLVDFAGRAAPTPASVRDSVAAWRPGERLWAVVLRDGLPVGLETAFHAPDPAPARAMDALTPKEEAARESHLEAARATAAKPLSPLSTPVLTVPLGEKLWVRFPQGLPRLSAGDVVVAETAAPLAADKKLDFLAVPPGSKVWLSALAVHEDGPAHVLRLHAYKLQPAGGRAYPFSASLTAAAGSGDFARVTPGGSLVTVPGETSKSVLGPAWSLQLKLLSALALHEPEDTYRAGPGLWVKEVSEGGTRAFQLTRVSEGRSASRAGLKPGDRVYSVGGDSSARLGFADALGKLYGEPGSEVSLRVTRKGESRSETLKLTRGVAWRRGYGLRLRREGEAILAQAPAEGSPAAKAGVKEGMRLLRVGDTDASGLDRSALKTLLEGDDSESVEFVFAADGAKEKSLSLARGWYASPLKPDLKLTPYGD